MDRQGACQRPTAESSHGHWCPVDVDEANMMPELPNTALSDAAHGLDTSRQLSSIPRTEQGEKWTYPSAMQFYNALMLKRKTTPDEAAYMRDAVMAHNAVNERTWDKVLEWERMHASTCANPQLRRFVGRYGKESPRSFLHRFIWGMGKPFDRHDWFVNRCGHDVRYIIDYYDDPKAGDDVQVYIDARPALDSLGALYDRIRRSFKRQQP
ncbi:Cytochrome c-type heme lyase [Babesia sp. Xinjiang]|uniref:Cytochrome c-type heme lyase n=1 Tax=Babesia sp. Xinjiang TaxID=462227 RepID=UPI000A264BB4|nr:Cytochrome c-type heme lyase [Babesia sp. Xinjiang]XP_028872052.1 Cytochrome c-type heme lyase [Babesia sp. Xinjiang]ORM41565.1 Cytochrome c-type heme lyase [Babesia sp. Xinjiang]ORM41596.1 Cytochrome c-type heme lyase [Babesia sp. Xinjiang]